MRSPATPHRTTVVGVDACAAGWVGIVLRDDTAPAGVFGATLDELSAQVPEAAGFGVDIPIGLPTNGERHADVAARRALGARRSSLFMTPVRQALLADTHAAATQLSRHLTGKGISRQAYALAPKILEAEEWVDTLDAPVWEVHPELSFTALLGHPAKASKKTWSGMRERLDALHTAGIELGDLEGAGDRAMVDDVIDAAIVAWSARRIISGEGVPYPDPPESDGRTGRAVAIWA
jgi:predicted RNase H-like nuclease